MKKLKTKSFFDLSDTEKKEVIVECAKESNTKQRKIVGWRRSKNFSTLPIYEQEK